MTRQHHGLLSLLLIGAAVLVGAVPMLKGSVMFILGYLILTVLWSIVIVYSYCSKCPCKEHSCAHIVPGRLAQLLPTRSEGPYTLLDYLGVVGPFLIILALPQAWLIHRLPLLITYWILIILGLADIALFICRDCDNELCPLNKKPVAVDI